MASIEAMARNEGRRLALADAGIRLLAQEGARGLTHRAVDTAAGTPRGTASNYFPTREDLIAALVERIGQRLTPDPEVGARLEERPPDRALFAEYVRDVVRRLSADPHVALALFELRLEAARRPSVAEALGAWRQRAFDDDVAFNEHAKLPGGRTELALLHYAIDGLMLDHLTAPLQTGLTIEAAVNEFIERLLRQSVAGPHAGREVRNLVDDKNVLVLINGAPGSGKSTIAHRVAQRRPMALALDIDGIKHNLGQWDADTNASGLQARSLALAVAQQHLLDGHDVIIGQYLARVGFIEELEELAARCSARFVEILLDLDPSVLRQRLAERRCNPDRPEHAINNAFVAPTDAEQLIASLATVTKARPRVIMVNAAAPADRVTALVEEIVAAR